MRLLLAVAGEAMAFVGCRRREVTQQIDPDGGGETRLAALRVDFGDELVEALAFPAADLVKRIPHRALEPHAGASIAHGHVAIDQR